MALFTAAVELLFSCKADPYKTHNGAQWHNGAVVCPCHCLFPYYKLWNVWRWHVGYLSNKLIFDLLTLKVVSETCVMWATSVSILVFLGLSVLELGPMYATDISLKYVRQKHRLMTPPYGQRH